MDHFQIHAPTQIIFGKNTESEAGKWCKYYGAHKVLVHFGGHSAKKSGLLDRVYASLDAAGIPYVSLGGVKPTPGSLWCMRASSSAGKREWTFCCLWAAAA